MSKTKEIMEILSRGGIHSTQEISDEIDASKDATRHLIASIRKSSNRGGKYPYIFITKQGYTLDATASGVIYETGLRLKHSVGTIVNGHPAFQKAKKIAVSQLDGLKAKYKPEFIKIGNIF